MPHTRRKKPPPNKRLQVADDSGWTHVTTTQRARRVGQQKPSATTNGNAKPEQDSGEAEEEALEHLVPAEAPPKTKQADLQRRLGIYRERWESSAVWDGVIEGLRRGHPSILSSREDNHKDSGISIVCIGLGSPSGFLRGGWVDRRAVSMYQLAALTSIIDYLSSCLLSHPFCKQSRALTRIHPPDKNNPSLNLEIYAQDPVFNNHDKALLTYLNISVLDHPHAFEKVTPQTILFCPGAERRHLEILLARDPAIVVGGPLEEIDSDNVRAFVGSRESVKLKIFEDLEAAFWGMSVYFPSSSSEADGSENENG